MTLRPESGYFDMLQVTLDRVWKGMNACDAWLPRATRARSWVVKVDSEFMPPVIWQILQKSYYRNVFRSIQLYHELQEITTALQAHQIPTLILKGAHLGAAVYGSIALRSMLDIDLLVPQRHVALAVEQLRRLAMNRAALGFRLTLI